jgi:hypothetical protein
LFGERSATALALLIGFLAMTAWVLVLLSGALARTAWVLPLLSGFLAAAMLLSGLLARVLILLTRILVLIGHQESPFVECRFGQPGNRRLVARKLRFPQASM